MFYNSDRYLKTLDSQVVMGTFLIHCILLGVQWPNVYKRNVIQMGFWNPTKCCFQISSCPISSKLNISTEGRYIRANDLLSKNELSNLIYGLHPPNKVAPYIIELYPHIQGRFWDKNLQTNLLYSSHLKFNGSQHSSSSTNITRSTPCCQRWLTCRIDGLSIKLEFCFHVRQLQHDLHQPL